MEEQFEEDIDMEEALKSMSCSTAISMNDIVKKYGGEVTLNGFGYEMGKDGLSPVFHTVEGDKFWASGTILLDTMIPTMLKKLGTKEAFDASLKRRPQRIIIHPVTTIKGGKQFRPIEFLGHGKR